MMMRPNRLYNPQEKLIVSRTIWEADYQAHIPNDCPCDGMRTWETWAAFEGIDWSQITSALDVGAFYSTTPFFLKRKLGEGRVVALDNYEWLEERKLESYQLDVEAWGKTLERYGIEEKRGEMTALPFNRNEFDLVTAISSLEHVQDWPKAVTELLRVGRAVVLTTDAWPVGTKYQNYGRYFSFQELDEIAGRLGLGPLDRTGMEEFGVSGRTLAVIRKFPGPKLNLPGPTQPGTPAQAPGAA